MVGPVLLIALGGLLAGGAWSLRQQKAPAVVVLGAALAAAMAVVAGILWQV